MSETPEVIFDPPVKKKKAKAKPRAVAKKAAAPELFPGLTRINCAVVCNADRCAISGKGYCAHPTKGALQAGDNNDPAAKKRMQQARDQIDIQLDPDRFK